MPQFFGRVTNTHMPPSTGGKGVPVLLEISGLGEPGDAAKAAVAASDET